MHSAVVQFVRGRGGSGDGKKDDCWWFYNIYLYFKNVYTSENLYCIFSRITFWINSEDEFLNKFFWWYFIIMVVLNRACLIWLHISEICEHSSKSLFYLSCQSNERLPARVFPLHEH